MLHGDTFVDQIAWGNKGKIHAVKVEGLNWEIQVDWDRGVSVLVLALVLALPLWQVEPLLSKESLTTRQYPITHPNTYISRDNKLLPIPLSSKFVILANLHYLRRSHGFKNELGIDVPD